MSRELDEQVAEALGLELTGWENAEPDPEMLGAWSVYPYGREKQPTYLKRCNCDLVDEYADSCDLEPLGSGHIYWCLEVVPFYSTDLAVAWELIEHMHEQGYWCQMRTPFGKGEESDGYWCGFTPHLTTGFNGVPDDWRCGDLMPQAICRAFLAAKE